MPGRAIAGEFIRRVREGLTRPKKCPFHCIKTCDYTKSPYCIIMALYNAAKGNLSRGYAFAGANAFLSKRSRASAKRSLRYRPSSAQRNCAANAARCRYNARQGRAAACFQNGIRRYFLSLGIVFV